jgi:hypothetical protein
VGYVKSAVHEQNNVVVVVSTIHTRTPTNQSAMMIVPKYHLAGGAEKIVPSSSVCVRSVTRDYLHFIIERKMKKQNKNKNKNEKMKK